MWKVKSDRKEEGSLMKNGGCGQGFLLLLNLVASSFYSFSYSKWCPPLIIFMYSVIIIMHNFII